jgi:hypothetical protein
VVIGIESVILGAGSKAKSHKATVKSSTVEAASAVTAATTTSECRLDQADGRECEQGYYYFPHCAYPSWMSSALPVQGIKHFRVGLAATPRAVRYRRLALIEQDNEKAQLLRSIADEADRGVLCTVEWSRHDLKIDPIKPTDGKAP